jgi:hypothetical protein
MNDMLHSQFRTLLKLTELVTAINNCDHPTLREPPTKTKPRAIDNLLSACATIIVRNHEIVAVGASGSNVVRTQEQMARTQLPFDEDLKCGNMGIEHFVAIVNPREEDTHLFPNDCFCILVKEGKSLLPDPQYQGNMWDHFHAKR